MIYHPSVGSLALGNLGELPRQRFMGLICCSNCWSAGMWRRYINDKKNRGGQLKLKGGEVSVKRYFGKGRVF